MSLPAGVQTVRLGYSPYPDHQGEYVGGVITVEPVSAVDIVHLESGWGLVSRPLKVRFRAGDSGWIVLLATDQPGFNVDQFAYRVTVEFDAGSGVAKRKPRLIALPVGTADVDLDLLTPIESESGVTYELPAVLSVAGLTGTVTLEQLQEAGLGGPGGPGGGAPPTTDASDLTEGTLAAARIADGSVPLAKLAQAVATPSQVQAAVAQLVGSAPQTLDTLAELSAALQAGDTEVIDALSDQIALKADAADVLTAADAAVIYATKTELAAISDGGGDTDGPSYITVIDGRAYFDPDGVASGALITVVNGRPSVEIGA